MGRHSHHVDPKKHVELLKRFSIDKFLGKGSFGGSNSLLCLQCASITMKSVRIDMNVSFEGSVYRVKKLDDGQVTFILGLVVRT